MFYLLSAKCICICMCLYTHTISVIHNDPEKKDLPASLDIEGRVTGLPTELKTTNQYPRSQSAR